MSLKIFFIISSSSADNSFLFFTFVVISLIPAVQGLYLMSTGRLPASTQGYIETVVWAVFAALFYFYSQQDDNSVIISDDEE